MLSRSWRQSWHAAQNRRYGVDSEANHVVSSWVTANQGKKGKRKRGKTSTYSFIRQTVKKFACWTRSRVASCVEPSCDIVSLPGAVPVLRAFRFRPAAFQYVPMSLPRSKVGCGFGSVERLSTKWTFRSAAQKNLGRFCLLISKGLSWSCSF